jgi:hypothetical protein
MHDGAAHVVFGEPNVADFHVLDEMARVHRRDMSRLGSILGVEIFNDRRDGTGIAQNLRLRRG